MIILVRRNGRRKKVYILFPLFLRNKAKEVNASSIGLAEANHPGDAHAIAFLWPVERKFLEAGLSHPLADLRPEIGFTRMARPDHSGLRRAKHGPAFDRVLDVRLCDVAEHTTAQEQIDGDGA